VQAFGKISVKAHFLGADLITISSHKLHGPKGVGALFCSKNAKIKPILFGGEQQKRLRPGTLPTQLIAGFGVAASQAEQNLNKNFEKVKNLNEKFKKELLKIEKIELNQTDFSFPYILNFSVLGLKSETLLNYLSSNNIYISSGSACSHGKVSHVLKAMNLPDERIQSSLRISFSKYNNTEQLEQFVTALKSAIFSLCKA
jgi:cysteine desulfurase